MRWIVAANLSQNEQRIVPYLAYADAPAALEFLCRAFGFEERFRMPMPDGSIGHAEITLAGHLIMLASAFPVMGFASPRDLPAVHSQIYVRVEEVDAHYERAKAAGATIATAPTEQHGQRMYRAMDPEGHRWIFATPSAGASGPEQGSSPACDSADESPGAQAP
jgi:PhnB protein